MGDALASRSVQFSSQIFISKELRHTTKQFWLHCDALHSALHFSVPYDGDDTCYKALGLCGFARRARVHRDMNGKDMCSPYGCTHGCLLSGWVHPCTSPEESMCQAFLQAKFSALQIVVGIISPNTQVSRHKLSEQTGVVCVWKMSTRKYLSVMVWSLHAADKPLIFSSAFPTDCLKWLFPVCCQFETPLKASFMVPLVVRKTQTLNYSSLLGI